MLYKHLHVLHKMPLIKNAFPFYQWHAVELVHTFDYLMPVVLQSA